MKKTITIFQGSGKEELLKRLAEIDDITTIDNFVLNNQSAEIILHRAEGRLYWKLSVDDAPFQRVRKRGRTMKSFLSALNTSETQKFGTNFLVICYQSTLSKRTPEGAVLTRWCLIDPYEPYVVEGEKCVIKTVDLTFTEEEFMAMMETGIAFYDAANEVCYPLKYESLPTVGRFIDCNTAFKDLEDCPLGPAFLLATRLVNKNEVNFLMQDIPGAEKKVRPILSIIGKNYMPFSHEKIVETLLDEFSKYYVCSVDTWEITGEASTVSVHLLVPGYNHGIQISIGRASGHPVRVTAFTRISETEIYLQENTVPHKKDVPVHMLVKEIPESFTLFERQWETLSKQEIPKELSPQILMPLQKPLGKKRFEKLLQHSFPQNGLDFMTEVCKVTNVRLNKKEEKLLKAGYAACMKQAVLACFNVKEFW